MVHYNGSFILKIVHLLWSTGHATLMTFSINFFYCCAVSLVCTSSFEYFIPSPTYLFYIFFLSQASPSLKLLSHHHKPHLLNRLLPPLTLTSSSSSLSAKSLIISSKVNAKSLVLQVSAKFVLALFAWVEARCCKVIDVSGVEGE